MLKRLISIIIVGLLLISCSSNTRQADNSVKMPYNEWRIGGQYPAYFPAKVFGVSMITQSNQSCGLRISIGSNQNDNPAHWQIYTGRPDALDVYADLPQSLNVCWVLFVDQTFYRSEIDVPLSVRQQMIIPSKYISEATGEEIVRYDNAIILGFAPGGNVTAWLAGVVGRPWPQFAQVRSTNLGKNPPSCENPYQDGKIPQITPEAKAWLKTHGMPSYWQEKINISNSINQ